MSRAIRSWARHPGEGNFAKVLSDNSWFPRWLSNARRDLYLRLLIVFAPLGLIAALVQRYFRRQPADLPVLIAAAGLTVCLLFWFLSAPDTRFGQGYILAAAILGGAVTLAACFGQPRLVSYAPILLAAALGIFVLSAGYYGRIQIDYLGWVLPDAPAYEYKDNRGYRIFVPKGGNQCWTHPIPCTPYYDFSALQKVGWPDSLPAPPRGWKPQEPPPGIWTDVEGHVGSGGGSH